MQSEASRKAKREPGQYLRNQAKRKLKLRREPWFKVTPGEGSHRNKFEVKCEKLSGKENRNKK